MDGVSYTSKDLDITLQGGNSYLVILQVEDSHSVINEKSSNILILGNRAPVAIVDCYFSTPLSLICDDGSTDEDSDQITRSWYVNNELQDNPTDKLMYTFSNEQRGNAIVKLVVNDGEAEESIEENLSVNTLPTGDFNCSQENSSFLNCSALNLVDDGSIESISWLVDEVPFSGEQISIQLQAFQAKRITLILTDNLGESSEVSKDIEVYNYEQLPVARFMSYSEVGSTLVVDGRLSEIGNRFVETYVWSVNGIEIKRGEEGTLVYEASSLGDYRIKLEVVDKEGRSNSFEEVVKLYDMEVPYPDSDTNRATLSGVDTDGNGVRDDIQRAINVYSIGSSEVKYLLSSFVRVNYELITILNNTELINTRYEVRRKIMRCIALTIPSEDYKEVVSELNVLSYNTRDRLEKYTQMNDLVTFETLNKEIIDEEACSYGP